MTEEKKQGDLRPKLIQIGKGQPGVPGSGVFMLGTPPGTCPECAVDHKPEEMHDNRSLPYQYQFLNKNGRWPTWADAIAHCPPEYQKVAKEFLVEKGMWSEPKENLKPEERAAHELMGSHLPSNKQIAEPGNIAPVTVVKMDIPKRTPAVKIKVRVGQVWRDNDPRMQYQRDLTVLSIKGKYATCRVGLRGKTTRVRLDRFKPTMTGYKLVKDAP